MKKRWGPPIGVVTAFFTLSLAMLWPLPLHLGRAVPGRVFDIWENLWSLWWVRRALWERMGALFYTDMLFYPHGASLLFHTLSPASTIPVLPVTILGGAAAAFGVYAIFALVLAGFGGYLLADEVLQQAFPLSPAARLGGSFLAGAAFAFSSYNMAHLLAHVDLIGCGWIALYLWAMLRLWREGGWRWLLGTAVFFALACWVSWYYTVYMLMATAIFLLVQFWPWRRGEQRLWRQTRQILAGLVVALALLTPNLLAMAREAGRDPEVSPSVAYAIFYSADPLAYITPAPEHPLWGRWTEPLYDRYSQGNWPEGVLYQGLVPLSLAALGARRRWKGRSFWLVILIVFGTLSLGPVLQFGGEIITHQDQRIFLPYAVWHFLPWMDIARVPARFGLLVTLAVTILAGVGAAHLWDKISRPRWRAVTIGGLILLLCADLTWVPYPLTPIRIPPFYHQLAQDPDRRAILELPIVRYPEERVERMLYQTVHEHPIYGGYISRGDPHIPYEQIPGFRAFQSLQLRREVSERSQEDWREQALAALNYYGAGHVVIERTVLPPTQTQAAQSLADALFGPSALVYEDQETLAYRVPCVQAPFWEMAPTGGVGGAQDDPTRLLTGTATLKLVLPRPARGQICLRLTPLEEGTPLSCSVDGSERAHWTAPAETAEVCADPLSLAEGTHQVVLEAGGAGCHLSAIWWEEMP